MWSKSQRSKVTALTRSVAENVVKVTEVKGNSFDKVCSRKSQSSNVPSTDVTLIY